MILSVQFYNYAFPYCLLGCLLDGLLLLFLNAQNVGIYFIFHFIYKLLALWAVFFFTRVTINKILLNCISAYIYYNNLCDESDKNIEKLFL